MNYPKFRYLNWIRFKLNSDCRSIEDWKFFQELAHNLFCRELGIDENLLEKYNQKYLETEPYERADGTYVGYQAKYYNSQNVNSTQQDILFDEIKGAHETYGIKEIYIYLSRNLTISTDKDRTKTRKLEEIEAYSKKYDLNIVWRTESNIAEILSKPENEDLMDTYFGEGFGVNISKALQEIKKTSQNVFNNNKDYLEALSPAYLEAKTYKVIKKHLEKSDFPRVRQFNDKYDDKSFNLFDYFDKHYKDSSPSRQLYISGTSGSGKSTCLYGLWEEYLCPNKNTIPIYVPMYEVNTSLKKHIEDRYLKHGSAAFSFDLLKSDLKKTPFHLILLLDGYNEKKGVEQTRKFKKDIIRDEIIDIFGIENITVIVSSRDSEIPFNSNITDTTITHLSMCDLDSTQITKFLGEKDDFLPKNKYTGMLTNPFMLNKCIETFEGDKNKYKKINQIPMEGILHEYLKKQMKKMRPINQTYLNVILPLVIMKLDERKIDSEEIPGLEENSRPTPICSDVGMADSKEIHADPKSYKWSDFKTACDYVINNLEPYSGIDYSYSSKFSKITEANRKEGLDIELLKLGKSINIFGFSSKRGSKVVWEHEIYRDYFVARGYALYSAYNDDPEKCVYNLARQINSRFPEEDDIKPKVSDLLREHHSRKVQMFIGMVESSLNDQNDLNTIHLTNMRKTAVYRRLTRDVAFIYRKNSSPKMASAAELSISLYEEDSILNNASIYDYSDPDWRFADAAYSLSGLGYACVNASIPSDQQAHYWDIAIKALNRSENMFKRLKESGSPVWKSITVRNDSLRCQGNKAAYNFSVAKTFKNIDTEKFKELISDACAKHQNNLAERIKLRNEIIDSGKSIDGIDNDIAQSITGIATSYFHLDRYDDALKFNKAAIVFRSKRDHKGTFFNYRNIVGCYQKMVNHDNETVANALGWMLTMLEHANQYNIYIAFKEINEKIITYINNLTPEEKQDFSEQLQSIDQEIKKLTNKSITILTV